MGKGRLEAFSDGVIAILITIMVLEMKAPHGATLETLEPLLPVFVSYVLSFLHLGIYWNNHHHMLHLCDRVTGGVLWANLHLLFWLSLVPVTTAWMGDNSFAPAPTAIYGAVLLLSAIAYYILQQTIIALQGPGSKLKRAIGSDWKGKISPLSYAFAILIAVRLPQASLAIYFALAMLWLVPDRRIERAVSGRAAGGRTEGGTEGETSR